MSHPATQSGFALISALVVLSLVTGVTVAMAVNQRQGLELTTDMLRFHQVEQYSDGILLWSQGVLLADIKENATDSAVDVWNQPLVDVAIEGGRINAVISDLQGRFNLNNLALADNAGELSRQRFRRLLNILGISVDFTDALTDWMDADTETRFPNGAEDDYYLSRPEPYRAANQPLADVSELLLVRGVEFADYQTLLAHVVVLAPGIGTNINTAGDEVLMSLSEQMGIAGIEAIKQLREESPITEIAPTETTEDAESAAVGIDADELSAECRSLTWTAQRALCQRQKDARSKPAAAVGFKNQSQSTVNLGDSGVSANYALDANGISVDSEYFSVAGQVRQYGRQLQVTYQLRRDPATGDVRVISRNMHGVGHE